MGAWYGAAVGREKQDDLQHASGGEGAQDEPMGDETIDQDVGGRDCRAPESLRAAPGSNGHSCDG